MITLCQSEARMRLWGLLISDDHLLSGYLDGLSSNKVNHPNNSSDSLHKNSTDARIHSKVLVIVDTSSIILSSEALSLSDSALETRFECLLSSRGGQEPDTGTIMQFPTPHNNTRQRFLFPHGGKLGRCPDLDYTSDFIKLFYLLLARHPQLA